MREQADVLQQFLIEAVLVLHGRWRVGNNTVTVNCFHLAAFLTRLGDWFFTVGAAAGVSLLDGHRDFYLAGYPHEMRHDWIQ
ncbi:hypothetical protein ACP0HM_00760 [Escherichia coli]